LSRGVVRGKGDSKNVASEKIAQRNAQGKESGWEPEKGAR